MQLNLNGNFQSMCLLLPEPQFLDSFEGLTSVNFSKSYDVLEFKTSRNVGNVGFVEEATYNYGIFWFNFAKCLKGR